jgi:hypothetical protein
MTFSQIWLIPFVDDRQFTYLQHKMATVLGGAVITSGDLGSADVYMWLI